MPRPKHPKSAVIAAEERAKEPGYSDVIEEYGIATAERRYGVNFSNLGVNTDGRPGFTRSDYDIFRPDEAVPREIKEICRRADQIYQKMGLVHNVIDLMADFAVHGVNPVHRNKRIEKFYKQWFKKVQGKDRSERFLNNLYRMGSVVVDRQTAKVNVKIVDELYRSMGGPDLYPDTLDAIKVEKREIPWKYTFICPVYVDVVGGSISSFLENKLYEIKLPMSLTKVINGPKTPAEKQIVAQLPDRIKEAAKNKNGYVLDPLKTIVYHYKKDDWQSWGYPMIYAIMDDIFIIEKLKLADIAALDGAISNIRIFKIGNLEYKIPPTKAAVSRLSEILGNNVGGGTIDLIWGPDIELVESKSSVHQFLGEAKYVPHYNSIYAGIGIPPTLTGTFGAAGTTNNFISLKTMTQRLQYGRDMLTRFWEKEFELVQKAMGFQHPAKLEFDRMDLSNEDAEKALLIQLADRQVISEEILQKRFGLDPDMENTRIMRETRERKSNRRARKAGPWNDPQIENSLSKIALQAGSVSPSQVGLELQPKKAGEKNALELQQALAPATPAPGKDKKSLPGVSGQGRPKTKKDSEKRKTKTFKPRTGASLNLWALNAQDKISDIINPILLDMYNKKNLRSLANTEVDELEDTKTKILLSLAPFSTIDENTISASLARVGQIPLSLLNDLKTFSQQIAQDVDKQLTVDDMKQVKASFYASVYSAEE
jgi:hypothetical protein